MCLRPNKRTRDASKKGTRLAPTAYGRSQIDVGTIRLAGRKGTFISRSDLVELKHVCLTRLESGRSLSLSRPPQGFRFDICR